MKRHRKNFAFLILLAPVLSAMMWVAIPMRASVAVLVEEPYGKISGMNPAGHSALYFDHVCAASPTKLRTCNEGELGSVISRYNDVGGYDWLAMPLLGYLYAVDSADEIPASVDKAMEDRLRENYRQEHLLAIVPDRDDGSAPGGNWYELVGSAYDRTLYGFQVKTTPAQEEELIAVFNDRKNKERYNGAFRNCADFARVTINRFYPRAVRRNFLADLGITTPKQVAHALSNYGKKHPEVELTTFVVPQVAGSLPRSREVKGVIESLLARKRYVLPITVMQPIATGVMFVAYMGSGRFSMPKNSPVLSFQSGQQLAAVGEFTAAEEELPTPPAVVKTSFSAMNAAQLGAEP